jgi:hypothetical protein
VCSSDLSDNGNQGYFFTAEAGTGNYLVIQNNAFHDFTGATGVGSLYYQNKALIEDNRFYNSAAGLLPFCPSVSFKIQVNYSTIRRNRFETNNGCRNTGMFFASGNNEICFNYFNVGTSVADDFNTSGPANPQGRTFYYRNTLIGDLNFKNIDGNNCFAQGPFYLRDNVVINPLAGADGLAKIDHWTYHYTSVNSPQNCIAPNDTNNLKGTPEQNIVDSNGNLTPAYSQYVGSRGWQTTPSLPPPTKPSAPQPPRSLRLQ